MTQIMNNIDTCFDALQLFDTEIVPQWRRIFVREKPLDTIESIVILGKRAILLHELFEFNNA